MTTVKYRISHLPSGQVIPCRSFRATEKKFSVLYSPEDEDEKEKGTKQRVRELLLLNKRLFVPALKPPAFPFSSEPFL